MSPSSRWPVRIVDLIGGCTVAACVLGFVWLTLIRTDRTSDRIDRLKRAVHSARRELTTLRAERDGQRALLEERRTQLAETGKLPDQAPVEEYFQTLSRLATQHRLRVLRHNPLTPRTYPGLLERRYAYEVTGSMPDLARFFMAIEDTDFWADVSYLKIDRGPRPTGKSVPPGRSAGSGARVGQLTISVFSTLQPDAVSSSG